MKFLLFCLAAFTSLAGLARAEYSHKEPIDQTAPFNSDGRLSVSNVNGTVKVLTWERNEIRIVGEKSAATAEELAAIQMKIETAPERASIEVKLPKRKSGWFGGGNIRAAVSLTITVPAGSELASVETVNGNVVVENVRGRMKIETVNGRVSAKGVRGQASFETVNGSIDAEFQSLDAAAKVAAETVNGAISLRLPADSGAALDASVVNGHVECDFPIQLKGGVSRRHIKGTIGSGGGAIDASTVNGSIKILKL